MNYSKGSRALLDFHKSLCDVYEFSELPDILLDVLNRYVHADWLAVYHVVNDDTQVFVHANSNVDFDWNTLYPKIAAYDPLAGGVPGQVFSPDEEYDFSKDEHVFAFEYSFRNTGTVFSVVLPLLRTRDDLVSMSIYRCNCPFSGKEIDFLKFLSPMFVSITKTILSFHEVRIQRSLLEAMIDDTRDFVCVIDSNLRAVFMPDATKKFMCSTFGGTEPACLPESFSDWLNSAMDSRAETGPWTLRHRSGGLSLVCTLSLLSPGMNETCFLVSLRQETPDEDFSVLEAVGLTRREIEVLNCLPLGYTNFQIASVLGITESTVKKHLHNVGEALHAYGRTEILYQAIALKKQIVCGKVPAIY